LIPGKKTLQFVGVSRYLLIRVTDTSSPSPASDDGVTTHQLFPKLYQELHDLAHAKLRRESPGHTLQTTALVHEVYMRLGVDSGWENPRHFFGAAAEAMRRILVERARRRDSLKRGGDKSRIDLEFVDVAAEPDPASMLALDDALTELRHLDPRLSEVVMLRYFSGLSVEETASAMSVSSRTIKRDWAVARAWLSRKLSGENS
jgi:RNA polymerase sigma factor (TIGR02999 family)